MPCPLQVARPFVFLPRATSACSRLLTLFLFSRADPQNGQWRLVHHQDQQRNHSPTYNVQARIWRSADNEGKTETVVMLLDWFDSMSGVY